MRAGLGLNCRGKIGKKWKRYKNVPAQILVEKQIFSEKIIKNRKNFSYNAYILEKKYSKTYKNTFKYTYIAVFFTVFLLST